jgi:hypothetical protein
MAVIAPTVTPLQKRGLLVKWAAITNADTCAPYEVLGAPDASCQTEGTFGGATMTLKGSNDGVNYEGLKDLGGVAVAPIAASLVGVREKSRYVKPTVAGGDGTQTLNVTLLLGGKP